MDNDLLARRLRPPSEPFQPASPAANWPTEDAAQPQAMSEVDSPPTAAPAQSPPPAAPSPSAPSDPLTRDDVPWDRPSDYADQTDSATPDHPAWDRPPNADWFEPDPESDVAANQAPPLANDWANELSERPTEVLVADEHVAGWPQAGEPVMAVAAATVAGPEVEPVTADPDDAHAPVLSDVSVPMGRAWPEMNDDDVGGNDATVAAEATVAHPMADSDASFVAPTPDAHPVAPIAWSELVPQAWPALQPDNAVPSEAPGQTSLFPDAVEPTTVVPGLGPTPPPGLFDDSPASYASSDIVQWDAPDWEASADEPEWEVPTAEASPEELSEPQTVSPYSTAPAPPTPFVVRIELSIVDEAKRFANPAEGARIVGAADFTLPTTMDAEMDAASDGHSHVDAAFHLDNDTEPDADVAVDADADVDENAAVDVDADPFMSRNAAFEPRGPIAPAPAEESARVEPAPMDEPAPRWAQPTYDAEPVTNGPVAPAPSPFAPPLVAGPYAQPMHAEPLQTVLSTEPDDVDGTEASDEIVEGKEPSRLLTGLLTIGMAVLVVVLVLGFIQLMTSLLR